VERFRQGCSLVLRRCERHDDVLRSLATQVASEAEGDVSIQVYATPAGFHSFGWHYDCEDVFIAQTRGAKEYFLRENTVNPRPTLDAKPHDMHFERETTPIMASYLIAGDALYIPRGWWHVARCVEPSLSISVGVLSPDAACRSVT
jgi:ribosomal protein L16 Arg81 hydroxylase